MSASVYVGRIGALAVGLGIGIAAAGMGSAAASPADSSSAGEAADSGSARAGGARAAAPVKRRGPSASTSIAAPSPAGVTARAGTPTAASADVAAERSSASRTVTAPEAAPPAAPGSAESGLQPNSPTPIASEPIRVAATVDSHASEGGLGRADTVAVPAVSDIAKAAIGVAAAVPPAVAAAQAIRQPVATVALNSSVEAPVAEQPTAQATTTESALPQALTNLVSSVLRLFSDGGPLAPAGAPAVWMLAAAARQEIDAAAAVAAPAAAVTNGAPPSPAPAAATPQPAASGPARGTATVLAGVNVRSDPSTSGPVVATYAAGQTFNYDSYTDANGYRWLSYISYSGARRYVAQQTLDGKTFYVSGGVPLSSPPPPPPPNSPPVISNVAVGTPNAKTGAVSATVTANDPNGDALSYQATTSARGGVSITPAGVFTYTPTAATRHAAAQVGAPASVTTDTVTVTVTDAKGAAVNRAVAVPISAINSAPVTKLSVGLPNATTGVVTGTVSGTDADKDALTYTAPAATTKGAVSINATTGAFTYTPTGAARHAVAKPGAPTSAKTDTFTVTVADGFGGSAAVPVTVTISPLVKNTPPTATVTIGTPDPMTGVATGRVYATDADKDALTFTASKPANGAVALNADGSFSYSPTPAARTAARKAAKTDAFTITVSDGYGGSAKVSVTATIAPSNSAPVAGVTVGTPNASSGVVTGKVTATDADGDVLTFSGPGSTSKGSVSVAADGSFTYTPTAAARQQATSGSAADKQDSFTVRVTDAYGGAATVGVNVTVLGMPTGGGGSGSARKRGNTRNYNAGAGGWCTWGAYQKWYEATGYYPALTGDAGNWDNSARDQGWTVVLDAEPRSIVVFESSLVGSPGHVAWVNSVQQRADGKYISITEMNYGLPIGGHLWEWHERTIKDVPGMSYILAP